LFVGTVVAYMQTGRSWWLVALVVLLPDVFMVGYLGGTRLGAALYNVAHAHPVPAIMVGVGWWQHWPSVLTTGLVWLAHIGLDRLMGYGLKYGDHFQHTHLGWMGRRPEPDRHPTTLIAATPTSSPSFLLEPARTDDLL
jgi:hypothetical protein